MNKKFLLISAALIAILLLTFFVLSRPKNEDSTLTTTVSRGPFEVLVYSTGQLESENSDNVLIPERMNDRQIRISSLTITDLEDEGTYVKEGAYIATHD